jgi:hypothetical protein
MSLLASGASGYPLDGYEKTGIRRLLGYRLANEGKIAKTINLPPGALRTTAEIVLRLKGRNDSYDLTAQTPRDPTLQGGLDRIFGGRNPSYGIALLDITDPAAPKLATVRPDEKRIPGSVGKLLVATGLFHALAQIYPDVAEREAKLSKTMLAADNFVYRDGKTVPFFNPGDTRILNRRLEAGDLFNLYEWSDHMLSQSSNAAASFVWKQVMLLREFGKRYRVSREEETAFFKNTPKPQLGEKALAAVEDPLKAAGLDTTRLRIGTMFTSQASAVVPGTASYACPGELMRWLIRLEQGKLVDAWSSLELKKLIYFARPRYRYASAPSLAKAAVFFKSGSLFECAPGTKCGAYKGTAVNLMHSVAIVESDTKIYLVAMMSNVLGVNSAVEHQTIAGQIEKLMVSP